MNANAAPPLTVACLCAAWCGSCRDYRSLFERAAVEHAGRARFAWVDIEDDDELAGGIDVETFPTLLLAEGPRVLFFGPLTPQAGVLSRTLEKALAGDLPLPAGDPDVTALAVRLAALPDEDWLAPAGR